MNGAPGHVASGNAQCFSLEAGWGFGGYVEVAFEGEAGAGYGPFVEDAADEGDAVRDPAGWGEFGQGLGGVGGPVGPGFGDFDEAGAEGERGVAGEVGDREDFVAEGGDEEEVGFIHDAGHLEGDHAAEAVGLDVVDGGEEAGLAEG